MKNLWRIVSEALSPAKVLRVSTAAKPTKATTLATTFCARALDNTILKVEDARNLKRMIRLRAQLLQHSMSPLAQRESKVGVGKILNFSQNFVTHAEIPGNIAQCISHVL